MSTDPEPGTGDEHVVAAGSSTDQYITGSPETGEFLTDQAPTATTPAHGSSNAGENAVTGDDAFAD